MDNPRALVARVAAGSTSSAGSSHSSGSSDAVVCGTCGDHLVNLRGHQIHCGRHDRCKGAAAIPIEQWRADRRSESQRKALAAIGNEAFVDNEAATINSELQGMYYEHMATATDVQKVTTMLRAHDERCKDEVVRRLSAGRSEAERESILKEVADVFSACAHIETPTQLKDRIRPAPARYRELIDRPDARGRPQGPRRGDHVYDVPIADVLKAIVRDNPDVLSQWREQAAGWVLKPRESITVYADITDGSFFREHPELGVAADRSDGALRVAFILYYDEVEVVNAIGNAVGVHKIGLFYWGALNYSPDVRMDLNNIQLATVALNSDISYYGIEQIVSGPPNEPNWPEGTSIGASLRALDAGITVREGRAIGESADVLVRGWLVVVSADQPAAALLTGTMVGTGAQRFCRQCTVDRRTKGFDCPVSFVSPTSETPPLRTPADRAKDMEMCGNCEESMHSAGWKTWSHAFTRCGPL